MNPQSTVRKILYSFGKIFWSIYFVIGIAVIGFIMAYVTCGFLHLIIFILNRLGFEKNSRKIEILAEYIQCYSIYVLLKIQPWLSFTENFQSIYNFYERYRTRRVMVVCNHRSSLDTFILIGLIPGLRGMAKKSIFYNVFFAPIMLMIGFVPVEKGSLTSFREGIQLLRNRILERDRPALVFPETTRCPKGFDGIGKFSEAVFTAALESKALVVPILIKNTDRVYGRGDLWVNPFEKAQFKILPEIDSQNFTNCSQISNFTHDLLLKEYQCS